MDTKINDTFNQVASIKVFGVGGAGSNAVNRMVNDDVRGVEFYVANTDVQALDMSPVKNKIRLGTSGLGAGGKPENGKAAAEASEDTIRKAIEGADMVFVTAGMGGGTGTGGAPIVTRIAKEMGCLTVAFVTKPFSFEGKRRMQQAEEGLEELKKYVDCVIVIANNKVLEVIGQIPFGDAMKEADGILRQGVQTITDLIAVPTMINLDFADVKSVMQDSGTALFGIGMADGEDKAVKAAKSAIESPLLDSNIRGAKSAIINVAGGRSLTPYDAQKAVEYIQTVVGDDIDTIFGVSLNDKLEDSCIVSLIATGFSDESVEGVVHAEEPKLEAETEVAAEEAVASESEPDTDEEPVMAEATDETPAEPVESEEGTEEVAAESDTADVAGEEETSEPVEEELDADEDEIDEEAEPEIDGTQEIPVITSRDDDVNFDGVNEDGSVDVPEQLENIVPSEPKRRGFFSIFG